MTMTMIAATIAGMSAALGLAAYAEFRAVRRDIKRRLGISCPICPCMQGCNHPDNVEERVRVDGHWRESNLPWYGAAIIIAFWLCVAPAMANEDYGVNVLRPATPAPFTMQEAKPGDVLPGRPVIGPPVVRIIVPRVPVYQVCSVYGYYRGQPLLSCY